MKKYIKWWLIATAMLVVVSITAIIIIITNNGAKRLYSPSAVKKTAKLLRETAQSSSYQQVDSNYGFSFKYETESIEAYGVVPAKESTPGVFKGESFKDDELSTPRNYVSIDLRFKDRGGEIIKSADGKDSPYDKRSPVRPHLTITTNKLRNYFGDDTKEGKREPRLDMLVKDKRKRIAEASEGSESTKLEMVESRVKVGEIEYRLLKVDRRIRVLNNEWISQGVDYYYMTVQNDRPYWVDIHNIKNSDQVDDLVTWQSVITSISYSKPSSDALVFNQGIAKLAVSGQTDTANIRDDISDEVFVNVIARNQLATVRIGSIRCADIDYTVGSASLKLDGVCRGSIGSGSFVSSNGVVSTSGHVTVMSDEMMASGAWPKNNKQWNDYYDFIVSAGYIGELELRSLVNKATGGNQSATQQLMAYLELVPGSGITLSNEKRKFIVQTSNDPIKMNSDATDWTYTQTNISAKLIDEVVDRSTSGFDEKSVYTDVALLQIDSATPSVILSSLSSTQKGDDVFAIGFPYIVDKGISTTHKNTVPSITSGKVERKYVVGGGHSIILMTTQVATGSSGGPSFDIQGRQIGINTYGGASCEDEQEKVNSCFGAGVARDAKDIASLASKNSIRLESGGEVADLWRKGIDDFTAGKYSSAAIIFDKLDKLYPGNYLVTKFKTTAANQEADEVDTGAFTDVDGHESGDPQYTHSSDRGSSSLDSTGLAAIVAITVFVVLVAGGSAAVVVLLVMKSEPRKVDAYGYPPVAPGGNPMTPPAQQSPQYYPVSNFQNHYAQNTGVTPSGPQSASAPPPFVGHEPVYSHQPQQQHHGQSQYSQGQGASPPDQDIQPQ